MSDRYLETELATLRSVEALFGSLTPAETQRRDMLRERLRVESAEELRMFESLHPPMPMHPPTRERPYRETYCRGCDRPAVNGLCPMCQLDQPDRL